MFFFLPVSFTFLGACFRTHSVHHCIASAVGTDDGIWYMMYMQGAQWLLGMPHATLAWKTWTRARWATPSSARVAKRTPTAQRAHRTVPSPFCSRLNETVFLFFFGDKHIAVPPLYNLVAKKRRPPAHTPFPSWHAALQPSLATLHERTVFLTAKASFHSRIGKALRVSIRCTAISSLCPL